jgi:site-specific recombinase XerD
MEPDRAVPTKGRKEDVEHPPHVWVDPAYANESLDKLRGYYMDHLKGRAMKAAPGTIDKYNKTLLSFTRSLERSGVPPTLAGLTPHAVNRWVTEQRNLGHAEEGIASRLSALKAFTNKYVYKDLELTTRDLLVKVPRITPPLTPFPRLTDIERELLLDCFDRGTYEDTRNQALVAAYLATGRRFREILELKMQNVDVMSGEIAVRAKGGDEQVAVLSQRALKLLKRYLKERPTNSSTDYVWQTEDGRPLSYWGGQSIFRRLKVRSGVTRAHAHMLRHNFAQVALEKGAERAAVQDMLGHKTDAMSRRYAGNVRQRTAAKMMPRYSPI